MTTLFVHCKECGEELNPDRSALGYSVCLFCGEEQARAERLFWCVAPMHKSNYMLFTNPADLIGINQKGGLVK